MKNLNTIGKILFALPFLVFGFSHLTGASTMAGMVPSFMPFPVLWVYITGVALIAAAISILIGKYARIACILLAAMLLIFVFTMHIPTFMSSTDENMKMIAMVSMLKDTGLAGGALIIAGLSITKDELE